MSYVLLFQLLPCWKATLLITVTVFAIVRYLIDCPLSELLNFVFEFECFVGYLSEIISQTRPRVPPSVLSSFKIFSPTSRGYVYVTIMSVLCIMCVLVSPSPLIISHCELQQNKLFSIAIFSKYCLVIRAFFKILSKYYEHILI